MVSASLTGWRRRRSRRRPRPRPRRRRRARGKKETTEERKRSSHLLSEEDLMYRCKSPALAAAAAVVAELSKQLKCVREKSDRHGKQRRERETETLLFRFI